jgi:hypothetical protein
MLLEFLVKLDSNYWLWTVVFIRLEMLRSFVMSNWVVVVWNIITLLPITCVSRRLLERIILATKHG